jgi:hypothetical protein
MWLGGGSPSLKVAIGSDYINSRIAVAKFFFNSYFREHYYYLGQVLLKQGYLVILAKLKPRELLFNLVDRVFQILALLNILEEYSF